MSELVRRSIPARKAGQVRVELDTGPPSLETRLARLAARWERLAGRTIDMHGDLLRICAAELRQELDGGH